MRTTARFELRAALTLRGGRACMFGRSECVHLATVVRLPNIFSPECVHVFAARRR